jgi:hypothetical protein
LLRIHGPKAEERREDDEQASVEPTTLFHNS